MNLSSHTFRHRVANTSRRWAKTQATSPRTALTRGLLSVIMCIGLVGWLSLSVQAGTFGPLADGDVTGLIDAIEAANGNSEADTIILATNGTYPLSSTADARIPFGNIGLPSITSEVTVQGNGSVIERDPSLLTPPPFPCSSGLDRDLFLIIGVGGLGI